MKTHTLPLPEPQPDNRIYINADCWLEHDEDCVTVFVKWHPLLSYEVDDKPMVRMVMVLLAESKVATQEELARAFDVDRATLWRLRVKYQDRGPEAFVPKKRGPKGPRKTGGKLDRTIVRMKDRGKTNQEIAERLGTTENAIRRALKRIGYHSKEQAQRSIPLELEAKPTAEPDEEETPAEGFSVEESADPDPENRVVDRLLARMGLLEDAAPLFQSARSVEGLGVLLAVPVLALHGVMDDAAASFKKLGAAFYGLRNTLLALFFCFLRGIGKPEKLKEHSPRDMGKAMGLDRAPEMKTLRRKIRELAMQNRAAVFVKKQLARHLGRLEKSILWVQVDGHLSIYSGKRKLAKHYAARLRTCLPGVLEYWINDEHGDPLLVMTGRARKGIVEVLEKTVRALREAGDRRIVTLAFDREGWSPALFAKLEGMEGVRFVTYRKASKGKKLARLPAGEFRTQRIEVDGRRFDYELADKTVHIDYREGRKKKRLALRQVTRKSEDGHQTHIVTNDRESPAVEIAYRMFGRWSQENFFKYMREHKDLDALVTYLMEEADSERPVPNPYREPLRRELTKHRAALEKLTARYGELALEGGAGPEPAALKRSIDQEKTAVEKLERELAKLPAKIPVRLAEGDLPQQVHTPTRRLLHAFRSVSYRVESALRELIREEHPRWRHESRSLIRTFLSSSGDIEPGNGTLLVTLDEQSSPHRTRLLEGLCETLNSMETRFPGSDKVLHFRVRGGENVA